MAATSSTPLRRAPWWMWAACVPFALQVAVVCLAYAIGPRPLGVRFSGQGEARIGAVAPGSLAESVGLRPGDVLVRCDGTPCGPATLGAMLRDARAGDRIRVEVERGRDTRALTLVLGARSAEDWLDGPGRLQGVKLATSVLWLALAFFVGLSRPDDAVACWGAAWMALLAVAYLRFGNPVPAGMAYVLSLLPQPLPALAVLPVALAGGLSSSVTLGFFAQFPARLETRGWLWGVIWAPAVVQLPTYVAIVYFDYALGGPLWLAVFLIRFASWLLAPGLLVWSYRRLADPNHRRRVRLFVVGLLIVIVSYLPFLLSLVPVSNPVLASLRSRYYESAGPLALQLVAMAAPFCVAVAILRHRLFDIRLMIRQGIQYAVARNLLVAVVPVLGVALAVDLSIHSERSLRDLFVERGWLYVALGAAGWAAHRRRGAWLGALDRRFFREQYDAKKILRGVLDDVRRLGRFDELAARVTGQIERALHPEIVAVMMRQPDDDVFRVLAKRPGEAGAPDLPSGSKLAAMLRLLQKPMELPLTTSRDDWLRRQLPAEETDYLTRTRIEWLFPIALGDSGPEALLAVGPKLSEEPYTLEDRELLETIATSMALTLEDRRTSIAGEVPTVAVSDQSSGDVGGRYRLGSCLGRGGMGMVYEAADTELERRVAVKLMHRELTANEEALARFRREARSAAQFSHPNVVTVHDFGVDVAHGAYLVMELLEGRSLRELLRNGDRPTLERALFILTGVGDAIGAAHARDLIHRDLKPENVFLTPIKGIEIPKVLDFGIAKSLESDSTAGLDLTAPGHLIGTPRYMAPEQLAGGSPSRSWDLWALAVIAYELLSGRYPFAARTPEAWREAVSAGQATPIHRHVPRLAPAAGAFFERSLAPRPERRPATVEAFLHELRVAVAAGPP